MAEDARLDDFLSETGEDAGEDAATGSDASTATHGDGSSAQADVKAVEDMPADTGQGGSEDVESMTPDAADEQTAGPAVTYAWSSGTERCADCGEQTERRWREGDQLVCPDCKSW
jgi:hypothetical protein